jgi:hypothetical protein
MRRADPGRRLEPNPARDWSTRAGAEALAAVVRRFWVGFGHDVLVWAEVARGGRDGVWTIKSSLRGGASAARSWSNQRPAAPARRVRRGA